MGALWEKTSRAGKPYISGHVKDKDGVNVEFIGFLNPNPNNNPNAPKYHLYKSEKGEQTQNSQKIEKQPAQEVQPEVGF